MFGKRPNLDTCYPLRQGVRFVHRNPNLFNIGDFLCSPRHYFTFSGAPEGATVVGGGIFDPRKKIISKFDLNPGLCAIWGAGFAQGTGERETVVSDLPFRAWSYRDIRYVPDHKFVPCVSCFHPVSCSAPGGGGTLVFLNDDPKVTPHACRSSVEKTCRDHGWHLAWNSSAETGVLRAFREARQVITNSFHGAYWGLLSGRSVKVLSHSMKFVSLFAGMGIEGASLVHEYGKRDGEGLLRNLQHSPDEDFVLLEDAPGMREKFQARNLAFAEELVSCGLFGKVARVSEDG